jgi:acylphosphatase
MMPKKRCFQFIVKDEVQDVGLRLAIAKLIPDELDVRTDNLPDGSVRVVLRGYERDVRRFWEQLKKHILGKTENPTFSNAGGITAMPIATDRFFHKLQCEQMEKFVDVGLGIINSINGMGNKIDGMAGKINGFGNKIDGLGSKIDSIGSGINAKLDSIGSKLDALPKNIANELAKLRKNGFF